MQKIIKEYKKEICKNCVADCYNAKGIVVFKKNNITYAKCTDCKTNFKKRRRFKCVGKKQIQKLYTK